MNRLTTKCLNVGTRFKLLTDKEIELAFQDALENGSAILSFTNHDFRDMSIDIEDTYNRINQIHKKYQNISTINSDAVVAMREVFYRNEYKKKEGVKINLEVVVENSVSKIIVSLDKGEVFGSQPYLAIKTKGGRYYHDNFNERSSQNEWEYVLDEYTIPLSTIKKIAVASNDCYGNQDIRSIEF